MAALVRLLRAGNVPQLIAENVGRQKLGVEYIHEELLKADEANLIDEKDMHVFGLRPLTDPLELVVCNACKKPIMASSYVAHAELCKTFNCREEVGLEVKNKKVNKKPPRKERKKSLTACSNKVKSIAKPEIKSPPAVNIASPALHLKDQIATIPFAEAKRYSLGRDENVVINDAPRNIRSAKRSKMIIRAVNGDSGTANGETIIYKENGSGSKKGCNEQTKVWKWWRSQTNKAGQVSRTRGGRGKLYHRKKESNVDVNLMFCNNIYYLLQKMQMSQFPLQLRYTILKETIAFDHLSPIFIMLTHHLIRHKNTRWVKILITQCNNKLIKYLHNAHN